MTPLASETFLSMKQKPETRSPKTILKYLKLFSACFLHACIEWPYAIGIRSLLINYLLHSVHNQQKFQIWFWVLGFGFSGFGILSLVCVDCFLIVFLSDQKQKWKFLFVCTSVQVFIINKNFKCGFAVLRFWVLGFSSLVCVDCFPLRSETLLRETRADFGGVAKLFKKCSRAGGPLGVRSVTTTIADDIKKRHLTEKSGLKSGLTKNL